MPAIGQKRTSVKGLLTSMLLMAIYMKKQIAFLAGVFLASASAWAVSDKEICDVRGDLMASIAKARDQGTTKRQVRRVVQDSLRVPLPAAFDTYVDAVYAGKQYGPDDIRTIAIYSCYKEFGLIK